ncbi:MAG: anaerobic ribonucleoside-triphosphate reductase activating protein [Syntrophobacterales bacterium]|jgi:pyruvate formate lyase activating enzyme|nr:anaerobic ribonucleoside-triphosphate reductase activating protein [Syntrophobacterales bacterium]
MVAVGGLQKVSLIDYPGCISAVIFLQGCNFRCGYCHNPELVDPELYGPLLQEEDILAFLEKRAGKLDAVTITGGEPTLQEGLPDFIRRIRSLGFRIKLDTNGSHGEMLKFMLAENLLDYVAMDIKAPINRYDRVCRVNVNKDEITQSMRIIMDSPVVYEFRTTLLQDLLNDDDFHALWKLISGARLFVLQNFTPSEVLDERCLSRLPLSPDDLQRLALAAGRHVEKVIIRR